MALTSRFIAIDKAILVATGNSLVVCGSTSEIDVNSSDLIKIDGNTTRDWTQAGSTANLNILSNSTILYAELVWYSTVFSTAKGALDLRSVQDDKITFTTPKGNFEIIPKYTESYSATSGSVDRYRAADVTSYVRSGLSGTYAVSKVPTSVPDTGLSNTKAGWSLVVIYRNNAFTPQKVIYMSGISATSKNIPLQTTVSGFSTSSSETDLKGSIFLAASNASPLNGSKYVSVGPSFAQLSNIGNAKHSPNSNPGTAPNNPGNNFFAGIINVADPLNVSNGLININGTNGTNNNDGFIPEQSAGSRNKWDITNVDISKTLVTNQTLLAGELTTSGDGDGIQIVAMGAQVNAQAPNITSVLNLYDIDGDNEYNVEVGEPLVFSVQIKNDGIIDANNVTLSTVLDKSTTFVPNSVKINNEVLSGADISKGVNIGTIPAKGIVNLTFTLLINAVPLGGLLNQIVNYNYQFISGQDNITNYDSTNKVDVIVQDGLLSIVKYADKVSLKVGDIATYTVNISNIGTEKSTKMFFQDKLGKYSSFEEGSVVIDGKSYGDYDPVSGISLQDLLPGDSIEIVFKVKINSLPPSTKIDNVSSISFGYKFNQYGYLREKTIFSNISSLQIQFIEVIGERCDDNPYPNIGDEVTYTLNLTNIGNIPAENVQVLEPAISGATFVSGSVKINGVSNTGLNPFEGFTLSDSINSKQTTIVTYKVKVNSISPADKIENIAKVPFKYQILPTENVVETEKDSNRVDTVANFVCMNIVESVDKDHATIDDILYYTVKIGNTGNIDATNTVFLSNIQSETSFIPGTVTVNGMKYSTYNPTQGFSIGTVCPDNSVEVVFQVKVNAVPNPNIVKNKSDLVYSYQPDPNSGALTNSVYSNTVETIINKASYTMIKSVNKQYAQLGDLLVYTTDITNTGTVIINDVVFADFIGKWLNLYPESVYIDGVNYPDYDPSQSFKIGDLQPGETITIVFGATIVENPPVGYIPNISEATINYQLNPNTPKISKTIYSNEVVTYDPTGNLSLVKNVDKSYAVVGDILTYSFTASNTGNASIVNTIFNDILQTEVSFVSESVYINGVNKPDFNPQDGFTLGKLEPGKAVTINFKVKVNSLPNPNTIINSATILFSYYINPNEQPVDKESSSNTVTTIINAYSASLEKIVDKMYAAVGETLTYTITARNTGTVPLVGVRLVDIVPNGTSFVDGTVIINGISDTEANPNNGFTVPDISAKGLSVVTFQVIVNSIPTPPQLINKANIKFKYQLLPPKYEDGSLDSNTVTTNVSKMSVTNTKFVDKVYATLGDTLTYTSVIENKGNVDLKNTNFIDNIPESTKFVEGSVTINGKDYTDYDPSKGFSVDTINPDKSATVVFKVTVDSVPSSGYVTNTSTLNYQYNIDPNSPSISAYVNSNSVTTYINMGNLTVTKDANRTITKLNTEITYNFVVSNTGNTTLSNLVFKDTIQAESKFKSGSVYIDGINMNDYNPNEGFSLDDIPIGHQVKISFIVTVESIPSENKLLNTGNVTYSYLVDPTKDPITNTKTSNQTTVYVYDTIISADKTVDKSVAKINDELTFTININNEGNVPAQSVKFTDILDKNIKLVPDSVYINGNQEKGYDPSSGFDLPDIESKTITTVTFKATIITRPSNNAIYNFAKIDYEYTIDQQTTTATINTNTTTTYVAVGELTINKLVDKVYASVGDKLAYSVKFQNTGSVNATNLTFHDLAPESTSFIGGTVVVDGIEEPTFDPGVGFKVHDLLPGEYHIITFSVHVDTLPQNGKVENTADVTFTYKLTASDDSVTTTSYSNKVTTYIELGNLAITKLVDKIYATIGDTINYNITINNTGNATCSNILFRDIVQSDAELVEDSVMVNGTIQRGYNPSTGFNIPDINGYSSATVSFSVVVKKVPTNSIIYNTANTKYSYHVDPANSPISTEATSNKVATTINVGSLNVTKAVSKAYATIDDALIYTISVLNNGNVTAKNVNFRDVIPNGLKFEVSSVIINGTSYPEYDPYSSFTLGSIEPGATVVISFNTKVTSLPTPSLIYNTANLTFAYRIDPNTSDKYAQVNSNTVSTQINLGSLNLNKTVDKSYATMDDVITYTVVVTNNGNVDALSVKFVDNLQADVTFNAGSVIIDGKPYTDYDPHVGFDIGTITTLSYVSVVFTATVVKKPTNSEVLNFALGTFNYYVDPNGQLYGKTQNSNTVVTRLVIPSLTNTKIVDKEYATLQDKLNYGIQVKNTGNTTISSLFFTDVLSNGAVFDGGTVVIDGVSYTDLDPITGFNLPSNLSPGSIATVQFKATVTNIPVPPQVTNYATTSGIYHIDPQGPSYPTSTTSNTVTTYINQGSLSNTKSVDKMYAKVGDTVTYTSIITNTGNVTATNIKFIDSLQSELTYVSGTVTIDGVVYPSYDPAVGFVLADLGPGQNVIVSFSAKINTLPVPSYVTNTSHVQFNYLINPSGIPTTTTQDSNTVTTYVVLGQINVNKVVDKSIATIGDILTYTVTLTNAGNVIGNDVMFYDTPSTGATFNSGSVTINGESKPNYDPTVGFSIGDIGIGNVVTVVFKATVVSVPQNNKVSNQATITFKYVVDPKQQPYSTTTYSNTVTTNIAYGNLDVTKAVNKKFATIGDKITYTITITNVGNIDATNVVFLDPTPRNSMFVMGSVTINGTSYTDYNPAAGFDLNTMVPGQIITVVYQVQVLNLC